MSCNWRKVKLNEIVEHQKGFAFKSKDYIETGTPVVRVSNFTMDSIDCSDLKFVDDAIAKKNMSVKLVENDVVIATVGSWPTNPASVVGKTICVPKSVDGSLLNQNAVRLRVKNKESYDQKFLYYLLKNQDFSDYIVSTAQGSANQASITLKDIYGYEFLYPESEHRKTIASHLSAIDKKISLNTQTNQTLEEMAQALFKSWFVDFDPVKAKMNGEQPEGMDEATASLFPDKLVESELGLIPEGWNVKSIKDFGKVVTGKTPPQKVDDAYSESGVPFITPTDIDSDVFVAETKRFLSESGVEVVKKNLLPEGSICVTCIGSQMGKAVIAPSVSISNQQINSIVTKKSYERNFLFLNLRRRREEIFLIGSSGSTMPIINKSTFEKLKVVTPAESLIKVFDEILSPLLDKIHQNATENQTLSTLRDTLLPKLLSGDDKLSSPIAESGGIN